MFQAGAFEDDLLWITEVEDSAWQPLRQQLEAVGLIQVEPLPGVSVPYLKFHPTLAPALWAPLPKAAQQELLNRHRQRYYELSKYLYYEDNRNPDAIRSIARRELPNLMFAVKEAIAAQEDWAIDFVVRVSRFLDYFGLNRDRAALNQQTADSLVVTAGSQSCFLARSNEAKQLRDAGSATAAARKFEQILAGLGSQPSYNRCYTLKNLGLCLAAQRQLSAAAQCYQHALAEVDPFDASNDVKHLKGGLQIELAIVLMDMGDYAGAKAAYRTGLVIAREQGDSRQLGIIKGELGTLALVQGNLAEAKQSYQEAIAIFQRLNEPATEAIYRHQLGIVYQEAQQWQAAEQACRRSAELAESVGDRLGAAQTWGNLAIVTQFSGNPREAEAWYRKALAAQKAQGDVAGTSTNFYNLANLLRQQPDRLPEARQLAEEALAIQQTLDPAARIWETYNILAEIADRQQQPDQAQTYRRQARQSKAAFAGTRYELQKFLPLINAVVAATADSAARQELEADLEDWEQQGSQNLVAAIQRIWAGDRDEDTLCASLSLEESMVVMAIVGGIGDRGTLEALRIEES